jgi:hypothetical protein
MKTKHYVILIVIAGITAYIFRQRISAWMSQYRITSQIQEAGQHRAEQVAVQQGVVQERVNEAILGLIGGPL